MTCRDVRIRGIRVRRGSAFGRYCNQEQIDFADVISYDYNDVYSQSS